VDLAVKALCVYVSDFMKRIITGPMSRRDPDGKRRCYQEPCSLLELDINEEVPVQLAVEVTVKLMKSVYLTYCELMADRNLQSACDEIAPLVLKSVVHSSVKRLDCMGDVGHPILLDYYKIPDCDLVYKALPLFRDLQAVKLGKANRSGHVPLDVEGFKNTLVHFSSRSCLEADLEVLANKCQRIKCLDINGNFHVENTIFRHILRFRYLTELNLSEVSFLPSNDLRLILNSLGGFVSVNLDSGDRPGGCSASDPFYTSDRSGALRTLGCNFAITQRVFPRIEKFKNLTSLTMDKVVTNSLSQLSELKQLQKFKFSNSGFSLIEGILPDIGKQLLCLNLTNVAGTDIRPIGVHCRSLKCFHLCFNISQHLILPIHRDSDESSSVFGNVVSLKLYLEDRRVAEYLLGRMCNVKKLVMAYTFDNDKELLERLSRRKWLKNLEELHWGGPAVLKFSEDVTTVYEFYPDGKVTVHHIRI
jgi:hypothetical protein